MANLFQQFTEAEGQEFKAKDISLLIQWVWILSIIGGLLIALALFAFVTESFLLGAAFLLFGAILLFFARMAKRRVKKLTTPTIDNKMITK